MTRLAIAILGLATAGALHTFGPPGFQSPMLLRLTYERQIGQRACWQGEQVGTILRLSFGPWENSPRSEWLYEIRLQPPRRTEYRNGTRLQLSALYPASEVRVMADRCPGS